MTIYKPFKAEERNGYWILVRTNSGEIASYPTTKAKAQAEARYMNKIAAEYIAQGAL